MDLGVESKALTMGKASGATRDSSSLKLDSEHPDNPQIQTRRSQVVFLGSTHLIFRILNPGDSFTSKV
jgi:hypothetical protein